MAVNDPSKFRQIYNLENSLLVEADYDNIILIDPNKVVTKDNRIEDRFVQQENLVKYANLETKIIPRTKLAIGDNFDSPVNNTTIASLFNGDEDLDINFLKPKGKKYFDTSWSDDFTGKGTRDFAGANQKQEYKVNEDGQTKFKTKVLNYEDTQMLGIKDIKVKISSVGVPIVDISMVDIRGRALFEQGDNSMYSVFFNLPYPTFYLTLKGYYGKAIRYQLTLLSFNAKFEPSSGNFEISLKLMGRNSAILSDSIVAYGKHSPKINPRQVETKKNNVSSDATGNNKSQLNVTIDTEGAEKLREVYSVYKSKNLISKDFPEISMETFIDRCNKYEKIIQSKIQKGDFNVINDINSYQTTLNDLKQSIWLNSLNDFLDTSEKLFYDGSIYYPYLEELGNGEATDESKKRQEAKVRTETKFNELVKKLKENVSFGDNGEYILPGGQKKQSGKIEVKIRFEDITKKIDFNTLQRTDYRTTYEINFGRTPTEQELDKFINEFRSFNDPTQLILKEDLTTEISLPTYYTFGEIPNLVNEYKSGSFLDLIQKMDKELQDQRKKIEQSLTDQLAEIITSEETGLGFKPTIRNVFAVLFAGLDGFYRLMEKVHTNAWNQRKNPARLNAILSPSKQVGVDNLGVINGSYTLTNENTVYPWPQYFEQERQQDGTESYTIKYPGDNSALSVTQGYNAIIWPEVAFTEQYISATLQKDTPTEPQNGNNPKDSTDLMSVNTLEFPLNSQPYSNMGEVDFLYEIFERSYLATHYSNIDRGKYQESQIDKIIANIDAENIKTVLTNTPSYTLTDILKNISLKYPQYLDYLKNISSNGTGEYWTKYLASDYNTNYIKNYIDSGYNKVYSVDVIDSNSLNVGGNIPDIDKFKTFINSTSTSEEYFLDSYPFSDVTWLKNNLESANTFIDTINDFYKTKNYLYLSNKKTIARLYVNENNLRLSPFTSEDGFYNGNQLFLTDISTSQPINSRSTLVSYYQNRKVANMYLTESYVDYGTNYSGNVTNQQTTSLLNTPYFINAIQDGVKKNDNGELNPFVSLGYLYLNSLPLITTKEKIGSDYLASSLTKFSAIHRLPYAWVLKYGSIWHRYKRFIEDEIDILDDVWKDFDYVNNYDPINSSVNTSYSGSWEGDIILQSSTTVQNTNNQNDSIVVGFYPKVINDMFKYFYNEDLGLITDPSITNFQNATNNYGLKVETTYNKFFQPGFDTNNILRQLSIKNYHEYFQTSIGGNSEILLIPSMGGLDINQSEYECFNDLDKITEEVFDNNSLYNGSARCLWAAPNFGYFDNKLIRKPNYNEYIKVIKTEERSFTNPFDLINNQSVYANIEEIFGIFEPKILDEFEKLFLSFCDRKKIAEDYVLDGENIQITESNTPGVKNVFEKNLFWQMKNLFVLDNNSVSLTNDPTQNGKLLAQSQISSFTSNLQKFLEFDCILKMGNPGNFNRKIFNYFTENPNLKPLGFADIPGYVIGTLPGDGSGVSLLNSQANNDLAWKELKKYVGVFSDTKMQYTSTGSPITDFFKDMNVEFSVSNIQTVYSIIRIYAKEKLKDPTLNRVKFIQKINSFVNKQVTFNTNVLDQVLTYLRANLDQVKIKSNKIESKTSGNVAKLEYYTTLKTMNDKWISGSDFNNRTIFEDFLFLDRANRDIGDEFTIALDDMEVLLNDPNKNYLALVSKILQKNNFLFFAMPAYINFYGIQEAVAQSKPVPVEIPNSMFGTYLDVDYMDSKPKFVCVYVGKPSEFVASESNFVKFRDDSFDLRKYDTPIRASYGPDQDFSKVNKVVGFSVDYGTQNQSIFKSVSLDMSEKRNTAESNRLITQMGDSVSGNKVAQQTVSLYSIYKTRSYTCQVECVGDVMIQPTMYFNLRHVPLFYGPYWIMEVNHNITPENFTTQFKGVRMPLYSLPKPNSFLDSVAKNYIEYYKEQILKTTKPTENPVVSNTSQNVPTNNPGAINGDQTTCAQITFYESIPFIETKTTLITEIQLEDLIKQKDIPLEIKPFYYGLVKTKFLNTLNGDIIGTANYNIYNINALTVYPTEITKKIKNQICVNTALTNVNKPIPVIAFDSFEESLDFYYDITKNLKNVIIKLKDLVNGVDIEEKYAIAYTIVTLFWDQLRYYNPAGGTGFYTTIPGSTPSSSAEQDFLQRYQEKVKPENVEIYDAYNKYVSIFKLAFKKFN